jgi:hypothetical protein
LSSFDLHLYWAAIFYLESLLLEGAYAEPALVSSQPIWATALPKTRTAAADQCKQAIHPGKYYKSKVFLNIQGGSGTPNNI